MAFALLDSAPLNKADNHHNQGNDQQNVNERTERVAAHQAQGPEDDKDNGDSPQHEMLLSDSGGLPATTIQSYVVGFASTPGFPLRPKLSLSAFATARAQSTSAVQFF
jgi:hypothetical protein